NDARGKSYRKYLFYLRMCSTLGDVCISAYCPIMLFNSRLMYAESVFSNVIDMATGDHIFHRRNVLDKLI
ncbi:hypothetical protein PMAYCL1PPCAC_05798, partial [Pristionchus mayeri]